MGMRKKGMKVLSVALAAAMVLSGIGVPGGGISYAAEAAAQGTAVEETEEELQLRLDEGLNMKDAELQKAVLAAYNRATKGNESNLTLEALQNFTGVLDLTVYENADKITDLTGLGQAKKASSINISTCTGVTSIGDSEFKGCQFTKIQLPATIKEIKANAFDGCTKLTGITLPDALEMIGTSAFKNTGIQSVNFDKAKKLNKIDNYAFNGNDNLQTFILRGTQVSVIGEILQGCLNLTTVEFGDEVQYIKNYALVSCPKLHKMRIASTTTVSPDVFNKVSVSNTYTASDHDYKITFEVDAPKEPIVVPEGRTVKFPYYVSQKTGTQSQFEYILIGKDKQTEMNSIDTYLGVKAALSDGCYKVQHSDSYKVSEKYYTNAPSSSSIDVSINGTKPTINAIEVEGLKKTEKPVAFSIANKLTFALPSAAGKTITTQTFLANYEVVVKEVETNGYLYSDEKRTTEISNDAVIPFQAIRVGNKLQNSQQFWYSIKHSEDTAADIESYDLVVKTDNPDVLIPKKDNLQYNTETGLVINGTKTDSTANEVAQHFDLIANDVGTARITIYPKAYPQYKRTYTYKIDADVYSIKLSGTGDYNNKALEQGTKFNIFSQYQNAFGKLVTAADMSNFETYTNNPITFTSDKPDIASIDGQGNVTIRKSVSASTKVTFTVTAQQSTGSVITKKATLTLAASKTPGGSTETQTPGGSTETETPGGNTGTETPGGNTGTETPGGSTETETPGGNTGTETPGGSTETETPGGSTGTETPGGSTGTETPGGSTGTETPGGNTGTETPGGNTGTETPGGNTGTETPGGSTGTETPGGSTETETPGGNTGTETPGGSTGTQTPGGSTETETPGGSTGTETPGGSTGTQTPGGSTGTQTPGGGTGTQTPGGSTGTQTPGGSTSTQMPGGSTGTQTPGTQTPGNTTTGATVTVTKGGSAGTPGEAKFVKDAVGRGTNVVIPDTVTIDGIQYKVTAIDANAFKGNTQITSVKIGNNIKSIDSEAFKGCSALTTVTISDSVEKIGKNAFYNCKKLKTVTLNANTSKLTEIGASAFYNCTALTKITIPNTVTKIQSKAFYNCKKLKTVTINYKKSALTEMGTSAFQNCSALTKITLPNKLKKLGKKTFYNCKNLKTITVKSSKVSSVGSNAFKNIHKKAVIKVPKKQYSKYQKLFKGKGQKKTVKIKK
ncbi:MAG: leucine-rich repeat protein [Clostridium sp.]|nr:leucine-rich repeat protein [Clostridium sp.]